MVHYHANAPSPTFGGPRVWYIELKAWYLNHSYIELVRGYSVALIFQSLTTVSVRKV